MRGYTWARHSTLLDHVYDRLLSAEIGSEYEYCVAPWIGLVEMA
jgi:hypothetical protein